MHETPETGKSPVMQWMNRELSIINIITIICIPVSIGFGINEYRTFKVVTERRLVDLEAYKEKTKEDLQEIKYNGRDTAKDVGLIKEAITKIQNSINRAIQ